jgi:hypothetical protein
MCYCEGVAVGDGTTDCSAPGGLLPTHNVGYLVRNPNSPTTAIGVMRLEGPLEVVRFPEQAKAATANTKATERMASREVRPHALLRIQPPARRRLARNWSANFNRRSFMNSTLSWKPVVNEKVG